MVKEVEITFRGETPRGRQVTGWRLSANEPHQCEVDTCNDLAYYKVEYGNNYEDTKEARVCREHYLTLIKMKRVKLLRCSRPVGEVEYTENLDRWDGENWNSGHPGHHLGIGETSDGTWYACHGTDSGRRDWANVIPKVVAKRLCLAHRPDKYKELFGEDPPVED